MSILLQIVILILGFAFLIKGADIFVDGASSTAANFKVPKILIGLTIVAFGTSAPELAVSFSSLANGSTDMLLGNVIGSNILNILLLLGIGALIRPIKVKPNTIRKELPICMLISTVLVVLFLDINLAEGAVNTITRADAIIVLLLFCVFLYYLFSMVRDRKNKKQKNEKPKFKLGKSILFTVLGLVAIVLGSQMVVNSASAIASAIGVSDRVIALTIVAFGTSLPELLTTITASRKGEQDLIMGNILGSNIFNICIVLGLPVAIFGTITPESFQVLDLIMLVASAVILFFFARDDKKVTRLEGATMLLLFAAYYTVTVIGVGI